MTTAIPSEGVPVQTGRWVLLATILASSMAFIDSSALNIALPALQADLKASGADFLWISIAYSLTLSSLILVGGSLGDHLGRKRVFGIGIALFAAASAACGFAPNIAVLIAARAIQGIGGALMVPGSLAIIADSFEPDQRGKAIGTWSAASTVTTIIGPVLGGYLAGAGLWRGVFFINLPLAAIALTTLYLKVPESRDETAPPRLDYVGAALAALGLAGVTYAVTQAPSTGLTDPMTLAALLLGIGALVAFVVVEARSDHPMIPLALFRSRTFSGANLLTLFLYGALSVMLFFLPLNLVQIQGYDPAVAGQSFVAFAIMLILLSRWAGGLSDRFGPRLPLIVGPTIVGFGFLALTLPEITGGQSQFWTTYFPGMLLIGTGMGITVAPLTNTVMGAVSSAHTGVASGVNNAVARTAGVLAIAIMGGLALTVFAGALQRRGEALHLSSEALAALQQEAPKLGDAHAPDTLPAETQTAVQLEIRRGFVDTFRVMLTIGAGLAWLSAALAALMIEKRPAALAESSPSGGVADIKPSDAPL